MSVILRLLPPQNKFGSNWTVDYERKVGESPSGRRRLSSGSLLKGHLVNGHLFKRMCLKCLNPWIQGSTFYALNTAFLSCSLLFPQLIPKSTRVIWANKKVRLQSILLRVLTEATSPCAVFSREDTSRASRGICTVGMYWPNLLLKLAGTFHRKRRDAEEKLALWRATTWIPAFHLVSPSS